MHCLERPITIALILTLAVACSRHSGPEKALEDYVAAIREGRCADARKLISYRSEQALRYLEENPQHPQNPLPITEYYCGQFAFEDCKPSKIELTSLTGEAAIVTMPCGRSQDSILPGFSSPFLKYEPRNTSLVLESGQWRVEEPHAIRIFEIKTREDEFRRQALEREEQRRRQYVKKKPV